MISFPWPTASPEWLPTLSDLVHAKPTQVGCPPELSPLFGSSSGAPEDCVYLRDACGPLFATLEALDAEQILWVQEMRGVEEARRVSYMRFSMTPLVPDTF